MLHHQRGGDTDDGAGTEERAETAIGEHDVQAADVQADRVDAGVFQPARQQGLQPGQLNLTLIVDDSAFFPAASPVVRAHCRHRRVVHDHPANRLGGVLARADERDRSLKSVTQPGAPLDRVQVLPGGAYRFLVRGERCPTYLLTGQHRAGPHRLLHESDGPAVHPLVLRPVERHTQQSVFRHSANPVESDVDPCLVLVSDGFEKAFLTASQQTVTNNGLQF